MLHSTPHTHPTHTGGFLTLDPVTLVPFEPKLIDFGMMTDAQIQWYNEYNARILEEACNAHTELVSLCEEDKAIWHRCFF